MEGQKMSIAIRILIAMLEIIALLIQLGLSSHHVQNLIQIINNAIMTTNVIKMLTAGMCQLKTGNLLLRNVFQCILKKLELQWDGIL